MTTAPEGILLVNKPAGVTSHDVVQVLRRRLGVRRIGHTGTLDPMAEGLLVLLVGQATRLQQAFQGHDKVYRATIALGTQTDTADAAGQPIRTAPVPPLAAPAVRELLAGFLGPVLQVPPAYSAVKVRGRPAYWWTRRQQPVTLAQRRVQLYTIELLDLDAARLAIRVGCSAGTYVRTLAEAIGERLGTVAHVAALTREGIGSFRLEDSRPLDWFRAAEAADIRACLLPTPAAGAAPVGRR